MNNRKLQLFGRSHHTDFVTSGEKTQISTVELVNLVHLFRS